MRAARALTDKYFVPSLRFRLPRRMHGGNYGEVDGGPAATELSLIALDFLWAFRVTRAPQSTTPTAKNRKNFNSSTFSNTFSLTRAYVSSRMRPYKPPIPDPLGTSYMGGFEVRSG